MPFRKQNIIGSLTSYPLRIKTVHLTIKSLLNQTLRSDKLILWLSHEEFPEKENDLPPELLNLLNKDFEIKWCNNILSYKKLIPALKQYKNDIIITFDDDLIYNEKTIELLYDFHKKHKNYIIVHRITRLFYNNSNELEIFPRHLYLDKKFVNQNYQKIIKKASFFNKLTGCGGCLYPPNCFHKDVLDEEKFMKIAPTNDDIWFWLQALRNKTRICVPDLHLPQLQYIPGTQEVGLSKINDQGEKLFFKHLQNIMDAYPYIENILRKDHKKNNRIIEYLLSKEKEGTSMC